MKASRSGAPEGEVRRCADVLGAFAVTAAAVRSLESGTNTADGGRNDTSADSLETALGERLADARDRTSFLRQAICRSDRGLTCGARYSHDELDRELTAVFEALGWTVELTESRDGLQLTATDPTGQRQETTVSYPETPLGTDNLPAVIATLNETLLAGSNQRFVLLSSGVDRWRAAVIDVDELDQLRAKYGDRVAAFERPLCPTHEATAFTRSERTDTTTDDPWPAWAIEHTTRRSSESAESDATVPIINVGGERTRGDSGGSEADGKRGVRGGTDGDSGGLNEVEGTIEPSEATTVTEAGGTESDRDGDGIGSLIDEAEPEPERVGEPTAETEAPESAVETDVEADATLETQPDREAQSVPESETVPEPAIEETPQPEPATETSLEPYPEMEPEPGGETTLETAIEATPAEPDTGSEPAIEEIPQPESDTESDVATPSAGEPNPASTADTTEPATSPPSSEVDGFTINGTVTVSRVSETETQDDADRSESETRDSDRSRAIESEDDTSTPKAGVASDGSSSVGGEDDDTDGEDDEWSISGTTETTRVSNDSFGTDDAPESEDDQYEALGAALMTGRNVSVRGLLDDEEFLPELPASGPTETRLTFEDSFDPAAIDEAQATSGVSGFVWMDSGKIEAKRVSDE